MRMIFQIWFNCVFVQQVYDSLNNKILSEKDVLFWIILGHLHIQTKIFVKQIMEK